MGAPLFPGHRCLHALAHRRSICHPSSAIHCGTHPLNGVLQRRTIFVLSLGETYCTCKCIVMDTVSSSPSRHVGTFHAHTKCRSSAKLPELRSSRRRRCCIRQAATDGAGLGRCQPPSTPSHRPQQAPYEVRLTTCGGKCTTPPIQKPLPCLDPRPEDPKLELETGLTGGLHVLALATPSRYVLIPHLPLLNHAQCHGRRDRDGLRGTSTVFLAHAGVEICEPRERSD